MATLHSPLLRSLIGSIELETPCSVLGIARIDASKYNPPQTLSLAARRKPAQQTRSITNRQKARPSTIFALWSAFSLESISAISAPVSYLAFVTDSCEHNESLSPVHAVLGGAFDLRAEGRPFPPALALRRPAFPRLLDERSLCSASEPDSPL